MAIILDGTAGITTPDLIDSSLTSGRVVYAGASGNLTGSAGLVFDGANLGINTSSPNVRLQVAGPSRLGSASGSAFTGALTLGGLDVMVGSGGGPAGALQVWDDNNLTTPRFIITRDGNQGLGIIPSSWASSKAIQIGLAATFSGQTGAKTAEVTSNAYLNSGWKYLTSGDKATLYYQYDGAHTFNATTATGTAGNAITWDAGTTINPYGVGVGGAIPSSGTGITFPATQSASSNANTLDDYEEGTFTPTFGGSVSDPTVSYSTQIGTYTKVGRVVTATINLNASSYSGGSGNLYLKGLPFTSSVAGTGAVYTSGVNWSTKTQCTVYTPAGGNTYLRLLTSGSNVTDYDVIVSDVSATDPIICTITYFTST